MARPAQTRVVRAGVWVTRSHFHDPRRQECNRALHHRHCRCGVGASRPFIRPLTNRNVPEGAIAFSIESEIGVQRLTLTPRAAIGPAASNAAVVATVCIRAACARDHRGADDRPDINVEEGVL